MKNKFQSFTKSSRFTDLARSVQNCNLCPRMECRTKVLSEANGNLNSKVLFIAEAPGRLGADKTGIPLYGDRTGDNFQRLLGNIGWERKDVFITNAILCNPRKGNGNNSTPNKEELTNCLTYLEMTIELLQPEVIVTLGAIALKMINAIKPHRLALGDNVGQITPWEGKTLVPLYHPGPRAMIHRPLAKQRSDFMRLAKIVNPIKGIIERPVATKKRKPISSNLDRPSALQQVILAIASSLGRLSYFKLTKLLYLADLTALERINRTLTGEIYLRQPDGPWPPKLQKELPLLNGYEIIQCFSGKKPFISLGPSPRFTIELDNDVLEVLAEVLEKYGKYNNSAIKTAVYMSSPMRYLLSQEKRGEDMRKVPVIYKNKKAPDTQKVSISKIGKKSNKQLDLFEGN